MNENINSAISQLPEEKWEPPIVQSLTAPFLFCLWVSFPVITKLQNPGESFYVIKIIIIMALLISMLNYACCLLHMTLDAWLRGLFKEKNTL